MPSDEKYYEISDSSIETIDYAFFDFVEGKMNLFTLNNETSEKVPVIWVTAERTFLSKNNKEVRDADGTIKLPIITIERTSITKDLSKKGSFFGNSAIHTDPLRGSRIVVSQKIVSDKTNNFAAADNIKKLRKSSTDQTVVRRTPGGQAYYPRKNKKIVYETTTMPAPVYLTIKYDVVVRTGYIQQMNKLTTPFATLGGHINSFMIERDDHRYETFLQPDFSYGNNASNMGDAERMLETTFSFEVLGYIIGESPNGDRPKVIKTENAVEVKIPREHVILGDIPEYGKGKGFYTE